MRWCAPDPHVLGGIEIYKGKPIFYSLGSLFFDFRGKRSYTSPTGQVMQFPRRLFRDRHPGDPLQQGKVDEIRLYPMAIGIGGALGGMPHPAAPDEASRILDNLAKMSATYGTKIRIENGVGIIRSGA